MIFALFTFALAGIIAAELRAARHQTIPQLKLKRLTATRPGASHRKG